MSYYSVKQILNMHDFNTNFTSHLILCWILTHISSYPVDSEKKKDYAYIY